MNKNLKGLITVAVVVGLGYIVYKKFILPNSKQVVIKYMDATFGGSHSDFVNKADELYIKNWATAIMEGKTTFDANGVTYVTKGGRVQK
jgi:hypothetical protein